MQKVTLEYSQKIPFYEGYFFINLLLKNMDTCLLFTYAFVVLFVIKSHCM
jgi:hypothetical protein